MDPEQRAAIQRAAEGAQPDEAGPAGLQLDTRLVGLTEYRVVHRAVCADLTRLAVAAAKITANSAGRAAALRDYLHDVQLTIGSYLRAETRTLWPISPSRDGDAVGVLPATVPLDTVAQAERLLHIAHSLARRRLRPSRLAVLRT